MQRESEGKAKGRKGKAKEKGKQRKAKEKAKQRESKVKAVSWAALGRLLAGWVGWLAELAGCLD